jgi:hypothetical protein
VSIISSYCQLQLCRSGCGSVPGGWLRWACISAIKRHSPRPASGSKSDALACGVRCGWARICESRERSWALKSKREGWIVARTVRTGGAAVVGHGRNLITGGAGRWGIHTGRGRLPRSFSRGGGGARCRTPTLRRSAIPSPISTLLSPLSNFSKCHHLGPITST